MNHNEQDEVKFYDFLQTTMLMRETELWFEEYVAFGDDINSEKELYEKDL